MPDPMKLNVSQREAVEHGSGPCLVLAGPGSGKTFVITHHINYLIQKLNIPPSKILVITFTKAASKEMQERFQNLNKERYYPVVFGTFHAFFFHILSTAYHYNQSNIISQNEKLEIITKILEDRCDHDIDTSYSVAVLKELMSYKNLGGENQSQYRKAFLTTEELQQINHSFTVQMRKRRKIDFDDMITECDRLFTEHPDLLEQWRNTFDYCLIDEFQDINRMQFKLIKLLMKNRNIFAVGDDDQSIYSFRGSAPEIMLNFRKEFENCDIIRLNYNYRSCSEIIKRSQKLIMCNANRYHKEIREIEHKKGLVKLIRNINQEEMLYSIYHILSLSEEQFDNTAIIVRTNRQALFIMDYLTQKKIKCCVREKMTSIYEHFIIKDLVSYLRLANKTGNREDFYRIMNHPKRYLGRRCLSNEKINFKDIMEFYQEKDYMTPIIQKFQYLLEKIKDMDPYAAIMFIRKWGDYDKYLDYYATENHSDKNDLKSIIDEFTDISREFHSLQQLECHIEKMITLSNKKDDIQEKDAVKILTYHGSKGLEFTTVILPFLNEGMVPHKRTKNPEEERRLFYVAVTRAKQTLYMLYVQKTENYSNIPSRFLYEMDLIHNECD